MEFLTVKDLQERYKLSRSGISKYVNDGILPKGIKIGASRRWSEADIEAFEEKMKGENNDDMRN